MRERLAPRAASGQAFAEFAEKIKTAYSAMNKLTNHAPAIASIASARSTDPILTTCQMAASIKKSAINDRILKV